MYQKTDKIWLDGKLIPWGEAHVHVLTHSLHYGVGVFEGIRYYDTDQGPAVFRLKDHMQRMEESARIVSMKLPFTAARLAEACVETVKVNGLKSGYIRPIAFISEGPGVGLWAFDNPVRAAIATFGWGAYLGHEGVEQGVRVRSSSYRRHYSTEALSRVKMTGAYFNSVLAKRESRMAGYDESVMYDIEGNVAEGTGENIFIVSRGGVRTPSLGSILPGITRRTIMQILKDEEGIEVREEKITREDLYAADEIFFTGTAAEVTPVREVDDRKVGEGKPGPITRRMQQVYADVVRGKVKKYRSWLTFVER